MFQVAYNNSSPIPEMAGVCSLYTFFMEKVSLRKVYTPEALNVRQQFFRSKGKNYDNSLRANHTHIFGANPTNIYI